jgi:serine/threonine-protein kinase
MLTGTWPFRGQTAVEVRNAVLNEEPAPLSKMRPGRVPLRLQPILDQALAKDPRNRYQKIAHLADDLRSIIREIGSDSLPGIDESAMPVAPKHMKQQNPVTRALRWLTGAKSPESASAGSKSGGRSGEGGPMTSFGDRDRKSVAILPFRNVGNDREIDFYQFSLADAVITELARVRSLIVRPSSVIVKYQNKTVDAGEAGRDLGVDAILTATFLNAGDRLRVTAQLLDVRTSEILWSERIDADASDIIGVQDTIVQRIVQGLRLELSQDEQVELARKTTANAVATEEYLRGRDCLANFIYHTIEREHLAAAIEHFRRAIEIDPNLALAYSALGSCYVNRVLKGLGQAGDYDKAKNAFRKALTLDPKLLEARKHMVIIYLTAGQKKKARSEVDALREEYPNDPGVFFVRGVVARLDGDYEKALRSFDRMARLNPGERVVASYNRGRIFMYQGMHEEAIRELDQGAALEPEQADGFGSSPPFPWPRFGFASRLGGWLPFLRSGMSSIKNSRRQCANAKRSPVIDDHRLDLGEKVEPVRPLFAAPAALLEPAPRRGVVEGIVTVHPHGPGLEVGPRLVRLCQIPRPNPGGQSIRRVIRLPNRIGKIGERKDTRHGSKTRNNSASRNTTIEASSDGLRITVFPVASAGAAL